MDNENLLLAALGAGLAGFGGGIAADRGYLHTKKKVTEGIDSWLSSHAKDWGFQRIDKKDRKIDELKNLLSKNKSSQDITNEALNQARQELEALQSVSSTNKQLTHSLSELQDEVKRLQMENSNRTGLWNSIKNVGNEAYSWAKANPGATLGIGAGAAGLAALPLLFRSTEKESSYRPPVGSFTDKLISTLALKKIASIKLSWDSNTEYVLRKRVDDLTSALSSGSISQEDYRRVLSDIERTFMIDAAKSSLDNNYAFSTLSRIMPPGYRPSITPAQYAGFGPPQDFRFQIPEGTSDFKRFLMEEHNGIINRLNSGQITADQAKMQIDALNNTAIGNSVRRGSQFTDALGDLRSVNDQLYDKIYKGQLNGLDGNYVPAAPKMQEAFDAYLDARVGPGGVTLRQLRDSTMDDHDAIHGALRNSGISDDILNTYSPSARNNGQYWIGRNENVGDYVTTHFGDRFKNSWNRRMNASNWNDLSYEQQQQAYNNFMSGLKEQSPYKNLSESDRGRIDKYVVDDWKSKVKWKEAPKPVKPTPDPVKPTPDPVKPTPKPVNGPWSQIWRNTKAFAKKNPGLATGIGAGAGLAAGLGTAALGYGGYRLMKNMFGNDEKPSMRISFG